MTTNQTTGTVNIGHGHKLIVNILTICTLGYLLPWFIAIHRGLPNHKAIGLWNFFGSFIAIGFVVALVLAVMPVRKDTP